MSSVTHYFTTVVYLAVGIVNLLPGIGVLSSARITSLYSVEVISDDMSLLLRHRAVLLMVVGLLLMASAFVHSLRLTAGLAGLLSMVSFIALAWTLPDVNASLQRIVTIDFVATVFLIVALILHQRAIA